MQRASNKPRANFAAGCRRMCSEPPGTGRRPRAGGSGRVKEVTFHAADPAPVAQLEERLFRNQQAIGSIPVRGSAAHRSDMQFGFLTSSASESAGPLVIPTADGPAAALRSATVVASQPGIRAWVMSRDLDDGDWRSVDDGRSAIEILRSL